MPDSAVFMGWLLLLCFILSCPTQAGAIEDLTTSAASGNWAPWTDTSGALSSCAGGSLTNAIRCRGRYCSEMGLSCLSSGGAVNTTIWTEAFSEEGNNNSRICPGNGFVTAIKATGKFGDNIALQCSEFNGWSRGQDCYWSAGLSEEDGGTYKFPAGRYLAGLRCEGRYCDRVYSLLCPLNRGEETDQLPPDDMAAIATTFAPRLRFDQEFGSGSGQDSKCFPSSAESWFQQRRAGVDPIALCNFSYESIARGESPIYYQARRCGTDTVMVRYWFFYAWQSACFSLGDLKFGHHPADWESILVKIVGGQLQRVVYFQHNGAQTKEAGHFETAGDTHPVAYVGKNAHASYVAPGGIGGCGYWDDFRNPGKANMYMDTWHNLAALSRASGSPAWMKCTGKDCFDGILHPIEQAGEICAMEGCRETGCHDSDVGSQVPM